MSARLSAGASFTPSPVIATHSSAACSASTIAIFCAGFTRAYTAMSLTCCLQRLGGRAAPSSLPVTTRPPGPMMPRRCAIARAVSGMIAGHHDRRDARRLAQRHRLRTPRGEAGPCIPTRPSKREARASADSDGKRRRAVPRDRRQATAITRSPLAAMRSASPQHTSPYRLPQSRRWSSIVRCSVRSASRARPW